MANIAHRAPRGAGWFFFAAVLFFASLAPVQAQPAPELKLIPLPREVQPGKVLPLGRGIVVRTGSRDAEDRFTAEDLRATLKERGIPSRASGPVVDLLRTNTASGRALLAAAHISFDPAMHDEGYVILPRAHGLAVIAATPAGLFYGAQTVKQLVINGGHGDNGKDAQLQTATLQTATIQTARIKDWPALPHRGLDDDLSRGPVPTLAFQERQVRTLAAFKLNIYSPYFEHTLQYAASPLIAPPGGSMSPA
ncbi:MAG TPA: glycoside hydrolase family 20 zincin-like fold domain-containing protein, partial [Terracidiphilus sp.]